MPVLPDDDEATLHERIKAVERRLYPRIIEELLRVTTAIRAALRLRQDRASSELAAGLHDLGWRLISSGGTAEAIADAGLPVTDVAELTGFPAILGHRVVTLHPAVHAGLLADLDQAEHRAELAELGIEPIGLLVVNLYPFASEPGIELIDVGGPAMIRAAAKNHAHVGVVVDPSQYGPVLDELRAAGGLTRVHPPRAWLGRPSPRPRPTTPPSWTGWTSRPGTMRRPGAIVHARPAPWPSRSSGHRTCATARTRTSGPPATASSDGAAGGTTPCSTAARSCRT